MTALLLRLTGPVVRGATSARARLARDEGQALVEYALILFFIAIVCVAVLTLLGTRVSEVLQNVVTGF
jgi:Flp pilus assembly pilin Flp